MQTYDNFRIIIRDDNSNDKILELLKSYDIEIMPQSKNLGPNKCSQITLRK